MREQTADPTDWMPNVYLIEKVGIIKQTFDRTVGLGRHPELRLMLDRWNVENLLYMRQAAQAVVDEIDKWVDHA